MNKQVDPKSFDELLEAYIMDVEKPTIEVLTEWVERYPSYKKELTEFTVEWLLTEDLDDVGSPDIDWQSIETENKLFLRKLLSGEVGETKSTESPPEQLHSLDSIWAKRGIKPTDLASLIEISVPILAKLNDRLIEYQSLPIILLEKISDALDLGILALARYLNQEAVLAPSVKYKSSKKPVVGGKEDFFEAVRSDTELTDQQKDFWLAFDHTKNDGLNNE